MRMVGLLIDLRGCAGDPTTLSSSGHSQSIRDNVVALFGAIRAWNQSLGSLLPVLPCTRSPRRVARFITAILLKSANSSRHPADVLVALIMTGTLALAPTMLQNLMNYRSGPRDGDESALHREHGGRCSLFAPLITGVDTG